VTTVHLRGGQKVRGPKNTNFERWMNSIRGDLGASPQKKNSHFKSSEIVF